MRESLQMRAARYFGMQNKPRTSVTLGPREVVIFRGRDRAFFYTENPTHGFSVHITAKRRAEMLAALALGTPETPEEGR